MKCFDTALEIDPNDPRSWNNKGVALQYLKKYKEAIECYNRALELDPKNARAWHNKGILLDKLGKDAEALRCYDRALEIDSETTVELDEGELKQSIRKE